MIKSMTGFGKAEADLKGYHISVEVRSVNAKGLKVSWELPEAFRAREGGLEKLIKDHLTRGHVLFALQCVQTNTEAQLQIDTEKLRAYLRLFKRLAEEENVQMQLDPASMTRLPDVESSHSFEEEACEALWPQVMDTARRGLCELVAMRQSEGKNLAEQFRTLCASIAQRLQRIDGNTERFVKEYQKRLKMRIESLLSGTSIALEEDAIYRETALFAEKSDVSEEIARLRSHLHQFTDALQGGDEPVGRKLEFVAQEMLREANTMAAKIPDAELVQEVLAMKVEIDQLREQLANVE